MVVPSSWIDDGSSEVGGGHQSSVPGISPESPVDGTPGIGSQDDSIDLFMTLSVPQEELINRILSREEGRSDDTPEKIKTRLGVYFDETEPVLNYYKKQDIVEEINGMGTIDEIFRRIKTVLDKI